MQVQPVPAAEARVDGPLVLRVLLRDRLLEELPERDREALDAVERLRTQSTQTTSRAVMTALIVAMGSRIFQPNFISWS